MSNKLMFRDLFANEIDVRVGTVKTNGISLLLYKDARCDMNILDETVGAYNWKRSHQVINNNLFAEVCLYDSSKDDWVCKQDVGVESYAEKEKGESSDSFKRACFNWGIGRKLYTSPFIWLSGNGDTLKTGRYNVSAIEYDDKGITKLSIVDNKGTVVFSNFEKTTTSKTAPKEKNKPQHQNPQDPTPSQVVLHDAIMKLYDDSAIQTILNYYKVNTLFELTPEQTQQVIRRGKENQKKKVNINDV